jgi:ribonuclease T1
MARFLAALLCLAFVQAAAGFSRLGEVRVAELPLEARQTLALIRKGGPFPYARDGVTFGNREGLLPDKPRGYYREYTVKTPGSRDRGARRIVAGHGSGEFYYTDDHYRSFRRILE